MNREEPRRIQLHDHADGNSGGKLAASATTTTAAPGGASSGGSSAGTSGIDVKEDGTLALAGAIALNVGHGLDASDQGSGVAGLAVDETELTGTLIPNVELAIEGGQSVIKAHGSLGSTATFDPTDGNVHTGTLTANCTFTVNVPSGTGAATLELYLTQDATGSRTVTWPGSVVWPGGTAPTLSTAATAVDRIVLETLDGGTTWYGIRIGGAVTSVALTVPAEFSVSGSPVTGAGTLAVSKATQSANTVWAGPTTGSAAAPTFRALVAADIPTGSGGTDHEHVMDCLFSGNASATVFELPAAPFDAYSVAAYVAGVLTEVTLSGAMLTTATFGSAPASGTNNVRFDIVAAVLP